MHSFDFLTSMELILVPNCSLLYLDYIEMEQLEKFILKNYSYKYNCYDEPQIWSTCK